MTVLGVSIRGADVRLTLDALAQSNQTVTVSYTPGANPLRANGVNSPALSNEPRRE